MIVTISVIMPVFNAEKYIEFAIRSVLDQTFSHWELLIIDDGSTDRSIPIIKKYVEQDSRIHFFQTKTPSGSPAKPRNIGITEAHGRFIAFLDSDDIWLPTKLQEQLPLFDNWDTAVVFSNYEKMSEDGQRSSRVIIAPKKTNYSKLLKGNVIGNVTGIYDTQKVGKVFFLNINHEDYVLWLSILKKGYVALNTNSVTALYRLRRQSVSSNKINVLFWQWNIYTHIEKLNYFRATYLFICYAYKAFRKAMK